MWKALIMVIVISISLSGCKSNDEKATELYNKALTAGREGREEDAMQLFEKIVDKYPTTQVAIDANQVLSARTLVEEATQEIRKESITMALQLYRLDNGVYPSTEQGLNALIAPPTTGKPARNWRPGGYVDAAAILDYVDRYESDGKTIQITMKR
jgi:hypothetical protein